VIELINLQKVIDQTLVLDIPSLHVRASEVAALVGPAGSGRAPLLDLLLGRARPTAGTVRLDGVDPASDRAAFSQRVGVLFGEDSLYKNLSARATLVFQCRLYGLPPSRGDEVLAQVGLADRGDTRAAKLASGLARRLAFGRAILHRPRVLLLAEPFSRCDEASIALIGRLIGDFSDQGGTVLVLAADDAHLAPVCDTIHLLDQGRIRESIDVEQAQDVSRSVVPFKVPVKMEDKIALINAGEVLYASARDGRAILHTQAAHLPTQFTLSALEERLARSGFFRAHRGYLVNLQHVKEVIPYTRNSYTLVLDDDEGTKVPLSKSAAAELRDLLGY
jgi:ABC-2 type transport system ATP-binding protein